MRKGRRYVMRVLGVGANAMGLREGWAGLAMANRFTERLWGRICARRRNELGESPLILSFSPWEFRTGRRG